MTGRRRPTRLPKLFFLKVTSDGTLHGTSIRNSETGAILPNVVGLTLSANARDPEIGGHFVATIEVEIVRLDAELPAQFRVCCPSCGVGWLLPPGYHYHEPEPEAATE